MSKIYPMPLRYFAVFALFVLHFNLLGQAPEEKSLLWKISGRTLAADSYLYGTIHLIGKKDYFLLPEVEKAIGKVNTMVFEIDLSVMDDFSQLMPLMMQGFMRNDTTLSMLYNASEYEKVADYFNDLGLPFQMLEKLKPMLLSSLDPNNMGAGGSELKSYEMEFLSIAQKKGLEMKGLETIAFQMSIFDSIPYRVQAEMLLEQINQKDEGISMIDEMAGIYKKQDIQKMEEMLENEAGMDQFKDLLLYRRNKRWIAPMIEMMRNKPSFFAVGAGHLPGEKGVISLLRKAGFTVEPLF
ncbi:MAG: TraB/GumN family protein [Bacteroidetes bacterium]|nr:TraB/GumN family protein [Bacteroidota bacterium]